MTPLIRQTLEGFGVRCKSGDEARGYDDNGAGMLRVRVGGKDRRKIVFKGWVQVENFTYAGREGSFCVMDRDDVCQIPHSKFTMCGGFLTDACGRLLGKPHIVATAMESIDRVSGCGTTRPTQVGLNPRLRFLHEGSRQTSLTRQNVSYIGSET